MNKFIQFTYKGLTYIGHTKKIDNLSYLFGVTTNGDFYKECLHNAKYSDEVVISNIDRVCS